MTQSFAYPYVGPDQTRLDAASQPAGRELRSADEILAWLATNPEGLTDAATFVVNLSGRLVLAPRRSEHVACAAGAEVLAAGELRFTKRTNGLAVAEVTNQSTGYCPDTECWPAVQRALEAIGVLPRATWSQPFVFRRCPRCRELNLVKERWFVCTFCEADLPTSWNVGTRRLVSL